MPISAVTDFYHMFASGASARLNRTTLHDMFTRIFEQESGLTEKKKGVVTFFNFTEIIFDISQEINVNRNASVAEKLKDYIEKNLMLKIKYRLGLNKSDKEQLLHRKRLVVELETVRQTSQLRQEMKNSSDLM